MAVDLNEPFPMIPEHIDMVFDLAGALSNGALSISTAVAQSDWVIIPIYDEYKSILA
ncbi:hypothetical protein [Pseudoalteromonas luteoviolacea]|uniref:Uncharacterized protein n=1 Tax=Pseudoalteromonas luteoviolacea S4054 TaxID=1129367 RepID=A0A0F6AHH8_9GAMM|nr:hypothetical protein [Pseudoalteromonas luteoviolacea]KKE85667.1 hypothetical protein N479_25245 [Pseudoalteromonas luteoviolacea S4054]KZN78422.1 hypothetical protein N481_26090 [Pseudoalteromonas luteoviolacea S4047-1]